MKKLIYFLAIIAIGLGLWFSLQNKNSTQSDWSEYRQVLENHRDLIVLTEPAIGQKVTSPLIIKGQARGGWFFEASFPATIKDNARKILAIVPIQTSADWMTANFVPFEAEIEFDHANLKSGDIIYLILAQDNPSGLPENDDSVTIPLVIK